MFAQDQHFEFGRLYNVKEEDTASSEHSFGVKLMHRYLSIFTRMLEVSTFQQPEEKYVRPLYTSTTAISYITHSLPPRTPP